MNIKKFKIKVVFIFFLITQFLNVVFAEKYSEKEDELKKEFYLAMDHYNKGVILTRSGKYEEAITAFDSAIKYEFFNLAIKHNPDLVHAYLAKSGSLYELGKYEEAIQALDFVIKYKPTSAKAYYNKGIALSKLDRYEEAIQSYDLAIKYNPLFVWSYENKAGLLTKLNRNKEATETLEKMSKLKTK